MNRHQHLSNAKIVVASSDALTPAGCFADVAEQVPFIQSPEYIDRMMDVCRKHAVGILIPLIDLDLERLAPHAAEFLAGGTVVVTPPPRLVELCLDKVEFAAFCRRHSLDHPPYHELSRLRDSDFPLFYKRRRGFGSIGSGTCASMDEAQELLRTDPGAIFQQIIRAPEVSVDAYIARTGACVICVPRSRDKVVAGEAYKTHTIPVGSVSDLAKRTVAALAAEGLRGPLNVQIFASNPPCIIEVNTRLGSASVLSNMAVNGRLLDALLLEALGGEAAGDPDDYAVDLALTRFLGDVFYTDSGITSILPS
jgi:carbamoyl-phosphate synthase large subunit